MAIEIVDFPSKNGGSFNSYVSLPEGKFSIVFCRGVGNDHLAIYENHPNGRQNSRPATFGSFSIGFFQRLQRYTTNMDQPMEVFL
jgi:hypothetical protein